MSALSSQTRRRSSQWCTTVHCWHLSKLCICSVKKQTHFLIIEAVNVLKTWKTWLFYCLITTEAQLHDTLYISMSYISFRSKKDIKVYITFVCVRLRCGRKSQCCCVDSWPANTVTGRARLPLAFAATSTVTLLCSFPWSWKPPAGYVKCFHMKHILVKSVKHQSVFQTESSAIWENSCVAQKLRRGQTTVPDNVSDTLRRTREKTCRGKFFFFL